MNSKKTLIKASYIIAFDGTKHRYLRDVELVYQDEEIIFVGKKYDGAVDKTIDAAGKIVSPGFISTHAHSLPACPASFAHKLCQGDSSGQKEGVSQGSKQLFLKMPSRNLIEGR